LSRTGTASAKKEANISDKLINLKRIAIIQLSEIIHNFFRTNKIHSLSRNQQQHIDRQTMKSSSIDRQNVSGAQGASGSHQKELPDIQSRPMPIQHQNGGQGGQSSANASVTPQSQSNLA